MSDLGDIEGVVGAEAAARRLAASEWLWCELGLVRDQWDPRAHPFLARWTAQRFASADLHATLEEHDHVLCAVCDLIDGVLAAAAQRNGLLGGVLTERRREAERDLAAWRALARSAGWCRESAWHYGAEPLEATHRCAGSLAASVASVPDALATLYAHETLAPALAAAMRAGVGSRPELEASYATRVLARAEDRVAVARAALEGVLADADAFALLARFEAAQRSYWEWLDALEAGTYGDRG